MTPPLPDAPAAQGGHSPELLDDDLVAMRGDVAAALGQSIAPLEVAAAKVIRLRERQDVEYTIGHEGADLLHWIGEARRAAQAALAIARDIANGT